MDRFERIQHIKETVRSKVLPRVKKTALSYETDERVVRRQIELVLEGVVQERADIHVDDPTRLFIMEEIVNEIFGLGPVGRLLNDDSIWEVMVNGPSEVYVEREGKLERSDVVFDSDEQLNFYIERILSPSGRRVTEFEPYVDARLPDGSRINVVRSPVAPYGPILTIRKARRRVMTIQDLIARRTIDNKLAMFLKACVRNHLNIVMAGGPGSGKTTIMNILASYIPEAERVITIEDTMELRLEGKHRVALETRAATMEGKGEITMRDLVRNALHMRPDRIIIGEVRGGEALDMLQSMNIGRVGSMTTLHANSSLDALLRLETMAMMGSVNVSAELVRRQIVSAIDLIICVDRILDGTRRVTAVSAVVKGKTTEYVLQDIYSLVRSEGEQGLTFELKATGFRPGFIDNFVDVEFLPQEFRS